MDFNSIGRRGFGVIGCEIFTHDACCCFFRGNRPCGKFDLRPDPRPSTQSFPASVCFEFHRRGEVSLPAHIFFVSPQLFVAVLFRGTLQHQLVDNHCTDLPWSASASSKRRASKPTRGLADGLSRHIRERSRGNRHRNDKIKQNETWGSSISFLPPDRLQRKPEFREIADARFRGCRTARSGLLRDVMAASSQPANRLPTIDQGGDSFEVAADVVGVDVSKSGGFVT